jgi:hypothetical protein
MASLPEQSQWEDDLVMGGLGGVSNLQAIQLGNRTRFLKDQLDALEERLAEAPGSAVGSLHPVGYRRVCSRHPSSSLSRKR